MDQLYSNPQVVTDHNVDSRIKNLRRKLAEHMAEHEIIRSVYGVAYKLKT